MAEVSGVSIDIDLGIKKALGKIATLKGSLKSLEDDLDLGVDLDLNDGQLDDIRKEIGDSDFKAKISPEVDGLKNVKDDLDVTQKVKKESSYGIPDNTREASTNFGLTDTDAKNIVSRREERDSKSKEGSGSSFLRHIPVTERDRGPEPKLEDLSIDKRGLRKSLNLGDSDDRNIVPDNIAPKVRKPDIDPKSIDVGDIELVRRGGGSDDGGAIPRLPLGGGGGGGGRRGGGPNIGGGIMDILPTRMSKWYNVLAILMPLLIAMAGAIAGVASAMIGAAGAGAALIGLGLVGHGEDMEEAFSNAREEISELGSEIFNVMQNPAKKFAPIQERIFDMIPGEMTKVAESMEGLTVFAPLITNSIKGIIGWVSALIDMFVANADAVGEVTSKFGNLIGHTIIEFLRGLIKEGQKSQRSLILFGHALKTLILIIYNAAKALSAIFIAFQPLLDVLLWVSRIINNKFVMSLVGGLAVMYALVKVGIILSGVMSVLGGIIGGTIIKSIMSGIMALTTYIAKLMVLQGVAASTAMTLSMLTLGLSAIAGIAAGGYALNKLNEDAQISNGERFGGIGGAGNGSTKVINNNNINIEGDADRKSINRMQDGFSYNRGVEKSQDMNK